MNTFWRNNIDFSEEKRDLNARSVKQSEKTKQQIFRHLNLKAAEQVLCGNLILSEF